MHLIKNNPVKNEEEIFHCLLVISMAAMLWAAVFTQSNHLKQHKAKLHIAKRERYCAEDSKINKEKHDYYGVVVNWEHEFLAPCDKNPYKRTKSY